MEHFLALVIEQLLRRSVINTELYDRSEYSREVRFGATLDRLPKKTRRPGGAA